MAFVKKTWKDRISEFPTRRRLTKSDSSSEIVTVAREEGTISQEGDAFSAENMNDLEQRIANEFTLISSSFNIRYNQETDMIQILDTEGIWHDFASGGLVKLIMYDNGMDNTLVTGGFVAGNGSLVKNYTNMVLTNTGSYNSWAYATMHNNTAINVTKYKKLCVTYSATKSSTVQNYLQFGLTAVKNGDFVNSVTLEDNTSGTAIIDIEFFSGLYYFKQYERFNTGGTFTLTISKIWME